MTIKYFKGLIIFLIITLVISSCGTRKSVVYFQGAEALPREILENDSSKYEIRIASNDNLLITVLTQNPEVSAMFNTVKLENALVSNYDWQGYLVDEAGDINFPVVGKLHLAGLTKQEAISLIQKEVSKYIEDPIVNIRFLNYKVTILGEVRAPGTYKVSDEKVTLPQAIGLAGDMTIYGSRKNVLLCREINGEKKFIRVDMTSPNVFLSPYYYLQQNDIVYVEPNKTQSSGSTYNANLPLIVSVISTATTIIALILK